MRQKTGLAILILLCSMLVGCGSLSPLQNHASHTSHTAPVSSQQASSEESHSSNTVTSTIETSNSSGSNTAEGSHTQTSGTGGSTTNASATQSPSANTTSSTANSSGSPQNHQSGKSSSSSNSQPGKTSSAPPPTHSIVLGIGSHGNQVEKLQQLLSLTGYLPLIWTPSPSTANSANSVMNANAQTSGPGTWHWRYSSVPKSLSGLWSPKKYTLLTKSAVMTFEQVHHLTADGIAGPKVLSALQADVSAHHHSPYGFTYVEVSLSRPQSLQLWHNGTVIVRSLANGGIPQSPTVTGTYPVYLQYRSQTMQGTNPDGTHYSDPGVPYVSYFYGGEAVHGFVRAHYGSPQSLGCVELPVKAAKKVWPYMHLGTLVHII